MRKELRQQCLVNLTDLIWGTRGGYLGKADNVAKEDGGLAIMFGFHHFVALQSLGYGLR